MSVTERVRTSVGPGRWCAQTWSQTRSALAVVRLKSFDTSTEAGRSRERMRCAALTALASATARAVSVLTSFISVPLTLHYLGAERYGLWMAISALFAMLTFADFGMGSGLMNSIAEAHGRDDREAARRAVSSGFFMLMAVATIVLLAFLSVYRVIPWDRLLNVHSASAVAEAGPTALALVFCLCISIPLTNVERVQMGYQEGFQSQLWQCLASLLGLGAVLLAIAFHAGLPWLVLGIAGAPAFVLVLNNLVFYGLQRPWLWPTWRAVHGETVRRIYRLGVLFFVLQLCAALAYSSDNIIIIQVLGAKAVTEYAVAMKLFSAVPILAQMALAPLWPAYGEAITRGDGRWVRRTLMRSLRMSLLFGGAISLALVAFGRPLLHVWVGGRITPPLALLLGMGVWNLLWCVLNAVAMFLNGANEIRFEVVMAVAAVIATVAAKVVGAHLFGLSGVIWGTVAVYAICELVPCAIYIPRILTKFDGGRAVMHSPPPRPEPAAAGAGE